MEKIDLVNRFLHLLHDKHFDEAADMVTENIFYHNIPMAPINGKADFYAFLSKESDLEVVELKILHSAANGDIVMNERIDIFRRNGKQLDLPVMGVFEFENDLIKSWRDYFDLDTFTSFLSNS